MIAAIEIDHLTKTYAGNRGVSDINLIVVQGEIFGFLGPNGAGKSTTLRTVLGFMAPTSGRSAVLGLDSQRETSAMHARIGNLPGEFTLDDRMTGRQLIDLFARLRAVKDFSYAHELAERLDASLDRPMRRLSRGNKQKIGIIQALFHQPDVVILDEPTTGLDPLVQETFLALLEEARDRGQTVFFSSHILPEIERVADRVGIIRNGQLAAVENPRTLTGKALRHVRIDFGEPVPASTEHAFQSIPGVNGFSATGTTVRFTVSGPMDNVIKLAAQHHVHALEVVRPSLEEIFLSFYGSEEGEVA